MADNRAHLTELSGLPALTAQFNRVFQMLYVQEVTSGSLSLKVTARDALRQPVPALWFQSSSADQPTLAGLRILQALVRQPLAPAEQALARQASRLDPASPAPSAAALLHAYLPDVAIAWLRNLDLLAIGLPRTWQSQVGASFGNRIAVLDYLEDGPALCYAIQDVRAQFPGAQGVYVRYHGLLLFGANLDEISRLAGEFSGMVGAPDTPRRWFVPVMSPDPVARRVEISQRRKCAADLAGQPLLLHTACAPEATIQQLLQAAPSAEFAAEFQADPALGSRPALAQPSPGLLEVLAASPASLQRRVKQLAGAVRLLPPAALAELELLPYRREPGSGLVPGSASAELEQQVFSGEIALVTGAATGIGKACVQALLERGAAVVGLDIKPEIGSLFDSPGYLGLVCDLTDEAATLVALETAVRAFGGLDMLILNAGIFPPSNSLETLTLEHWRKVLDINLNVNITLLREAYPLLANAPRYGRVVINASRNVPAPGPGAAAYSASKAALTQVGRVAALEWAKAGIRVNMLHPHAVFDTGIWTDEILQSRAAKYGLTVEEYKTNNLLGVELYSRDVGELAAEMCGALFAKTTGAQIPIDGGSDRVI